MRGVWRLERSGRRHTPRGVLRRGGWVAGAAVRGWRGGGFACPASDREKVRVGQRWCFFVCVVAGGEGKTHILPGACCAGVVGLLGRRSGVGGRAFLPALL